MTDYLPVAKALESGADPDMLCMTCPWDRNCITPPTMTSAEIDAQIDAAKRDDDARRAAAVASGKDPGLPAGMLITAVTLSGRDTSATLCPVLALRLKLPEGRAVAELVKAHMQGGGERGQG